MVMKRYFYPKEKNKRVFSIRRYDAADMNIFRSALSSCVLSGLDNIRHLITIARQQKSVSTILPVGTLSAAVGAALTATIDQIIR